MNDIALHLSDRMLDLLKADRDGRLIVLPCKRGADLWIPPTDPCESAICTQVLDISTLNGRTVLNTSSCGVIDARRIGVDVFLTYEEAEKTLGEAKRQGGDIHG